MHKWAVFFVCLLGLATVGCTVSSPYMEVLAAPQAIAADAGTATVVFLRPTGYAGRLKHMILDHKGRFLGECWGETYFSVKMPPGQYTFVSWSEGTPALQATLDAGKVYYVEVGVTIGAWTARARLFGLGPQREGWAEVPEWLANSTMLVPNEAAGQAHFAATQDRVDEVIRKGLANWAEYDAEARGKRSLGPADGVVPAGSGAAPGNSGSAPANSAPAPVSSAAAPVNSGAAATPAACRSHLDCKAPLVCPNGQCVAPACIADSDCGAGKMCTLEGTCAPLR